LKLAFKKTYTTVKWIKLAEDYIHLKAYVLWKREIYLLFGKVSKYHYGVIFQLLGKIRILPNRWTKCYLRHRRLLIDQLIASGVSEQMLKDMFIIVVTGTESWIFWGRFLHKRKS
jgi:hypothetical protein